MNSDSCTQLTLSYKSAISNLVLYCRHAVNVNLIYCGHVHGYTSTNLAGLQALEQRSKYFKKSETLLKITT